ncbi:MAG: MmgE/PrpD family protein [Candidatus Tectomicrobia bacterium]|nr:MmgE/PrpD family protein [Candidatus Tectomicrobia bacterium]
MAAPKDVLEGPAAEATEALVRFAADLRFETLPPEVARAGRRCLLNIIGVALGACNDPAVEAALAVAKEEGGEPQSRVLGRGEYLPARGTALVDGVMSHVLDYDDTHSVTILHPSPPVMSAVLPVGEWLDASLSELVAAFVAGIEVASRVSLALYPDHYDRGWHITSTAGVVGAAAGAGRLLGLDAGRMRHAFGLAATQAAGHREQFGSMAKSLHVAKAASDGILAALLARRGFTSAHGSLEGRRGMLRVMAEEAAPSRLADGLWERWEIFQNGIKPYACGIVTHPAIDAVRGLRASLGGEMAAAVREIRLTVHPLVLELTNKTDPQTGLDGKFSIRFCAALGLLEDAAGPRQFTDEMVRRKDVRRIMERVQVSADPKLEVYQARAVLATRDGRTLEKWVEVAQGFPQNPLSQEALEGKFRSLAEPVLGKEGARSVVEALMGEEDLSARELVRRCVSPHGRP